MNNSKFYWFLIFHVGFIFFLSMIVDKYFHLLIPYDLVIYIAVLIWKTKKVYYEKNLVNYFDFVDIPLIMILSWLSNGVLFSSSEIFIDSIFGYGLILSLMKVCLIILINNKIMVTLRHKIFPNFISQYIMLFLMRILVFETASPFSIKVMLSEMIAFISTFFFITFIIQVLKKDIKPHKA